MFRTLLTVLTLVLACFNSARADVSIKGTLSKWHPLTVDISGATNTVGERLNSPNPFLDFRFDITFTSPSGIDQKVPGFFAGDGKGNGIGDVWRARFAPDETGVWQYRISFQSGTQINVSDFEGTSLLLDGTVGEFTVTPQRHDDAGFLKHGRLEYVGQHYLKFADGPYWIKGGIDSPENFFGYAGFDNTVDNAGGANTGSLANGLHHYETHIADWKKGDPVFDNAETPESAKGIIGAINYLAEQGVNSIYFLPMNLGGDGRDTHPFIDSNGTFYENTHYDISKLYQWNIVLNHMQNSGIATHMVLAETEAGNSEWLDNGELGIERKLFYREMIARFSYLLGVKWNISEESRFGAEKHQEFAAYIKSLDWAAHPVTVHTYLNNPERTYDALLASPYFDASSIQFSPSNANDFVETWREKTAAAGRPWVIDMDEVGSAQTGLTDRNADALRRSVLYPVYFSGGNLEWYFGYHPLPLGGDMRTENFRTREAMYRFMKYAREMMQTNLPFAEMSPADELHSTSGTQVFAKAGDTYAVYVADGNRSGTLRIQPGTYRKRWFNPRSGKFEGTVQIVTRSPLNLGTPPNTPRQDWVLILDKKINEPMQSTDQDAPTSVINSPIVGSIHNSSVLFAGTASDNAGVSRLMLSIKNLDTGQNWNGSSFQYGEFRVRATGTDNWSYRFAPNMPGNYRLATFAGDTSGNLQNTYNGVKFEISGAELPTSVITSPVSGSIQSSSMTFTGTASDNEDVTRVMLSIKNLDLGQNWNGSSFQSGEIRVRATGTTNWSYKFSPNVPGDYRLATFAIDSSGNIQNTYNGVRFQVGSTDSQAPTSVITSPDSGTTQSPNITLTGTAYDNAEVTRVMLSIKNLDTGQNWNGASFQPGEFRIPATGTDNWSYDFIPNIPGNYRLATFAVDSSGNVQNTYNGVRFQIQGTDSQAPTSVITTPAPGTTQSRIITLNGTASDNVDVARVMLSIKNLDLGQNWNGSSFQSGEFRVEATGTDNWSYEFAPNLAGNYRLATFAVDSSGNVQNTYNGVVFQIQAF